MTSKSKMFVPCSTNGRVAPATSAISYFFIFLIFLTTLSLESHAYKQRRQRQHVNLQVNSPKSDNSLFKVNSRDSNGGRPNSTTSNVIRRYNTGMEINHTNLNVNDEHVEDRSEEEESNDTNEDHRLTSRNISPATTKTNFTRYENTNATNSLRPLIDANANYVPVTDNEIRKEPAANCPTCANDQVMRTMTPLTLKQLRLEMIKNEILRKLRLWQPPSAVQDGNIPDYVHKALHQHQQQQQRYNYSQDKEQQEDDDDDDDGSRTEQIVVFAENDGFSCETFNNNKNNTMCLNFMVPSQIHKEKVSSAELWIYSPMEPTPQQPLRLSISDMSPSNIKNQSYIQEFGETEEQWLRFNLTEVVWSWNLQNFTQLQPKSEFKPIRVTCESCAHSQDVVALNWGLNMTNTTTKPFLVVNMDNSVRKKRRRRSINCSRGQNQCCREHLEVNFSELGWGWIKEPRKYHAYFCKGSCLDNNGNFHSVYQEHTLHREKIIASRGLNNETQFMLPCCAATRTSGISIIYAASNGTLISANVPNLVVEACGCH